MNTPEQRDTNNTSTTTQIIAEESNLNKRNVASEKTTQIRESSGGSQVGRKNKAEHTASAARFQSSKEVISNHFLKRACLPKNARFSKETYQFRDAANQAAKAALLATKRGKIRGIKASSAEISLASIQIPKGAVVEHQVYAGIPPVLFSRIKSFDWKGTEEWLKHHKEECRWKDRKGFSPLHLACSIGSAPLRTIKAILYGWEEAALERNKYGEIPLHAACRNSQMSYSKVKALIDHSPESVSMLNLKKQSPLHVACVSNAMLPVIVELVNANPSMLHLKDINENTPAYLTWHTVSKNLVCVIQLPRVNERSVFHHDTALGRFWVKMAYLAIKTYDPTYCIDIEYDYASYTQSPLLLHAALQMEKWPFDYILAIVRKYPNLLRSRDMNGNLPLHVVSGRRKHWGKRGDTILFKILTAFSGAAQIPNNEGRFPLNIAIESGRSWSGGVERLFMAAPGALNARDTKTHLYPFMLGALSMSAQSVNDNLDTMFSLLRAQPDVVKCGITLSSDTKLM